MEPRKKSIASILLPLAGALFAAYIALHMAAAYDHAAPPDGGQRDFGAFMSDFGDRANRDGLKFELTESAPKFLGGALGICLFAAAYIYSGKRKYIAGKEYGTARWGTARDIRELFAANIAKKLVREARRDKSLNKRERAEEIRKIKEKYEDADMLLTATERASIYNYVINNNTLIIGGSGSGKTRGYVMPNILQAHSSYVVTDPKGEILEKSGTFLTGRGYKIRVLNLDEKSQSSGYNPFAYVHMEREGWEERILSLIETIIINTSGEGKSATDPFWEMAERLFLQALFFFTAQGFGPAESNMNTVMDLIRMLELPEEEDARDSDLDVFAEMFAERFGANHIGARQYNEFRSKASGKTAKSIVISAVARLAPFQVQEVQRIFSYDEMRLDLVGEEKTAVFVIVPPVDKTYNFIAGILFTQLFQELNHCALVKHKHSGQRLPVPCRFILDEFANTCRIPNFVEILAYARSLGVGITTVLQSLEQIKKIYEKDWGVIIDNSNTLLYLGAVTHMDTLEYLSKLLGKGTFDKRNWSWSKGSHGSTSQTVDSLGRELLTADEIRMMRRDKCLLIVGGAAPFYSSKIDYRRHKNYRHTSDGDKNNSFHFAPGPPPPAEAAEPFPAGGAPALPAAAGITIEADAAKVLEFLQDNRESLGFGDFPGDDGGIDSDIDPEDGLDEELSGFGEYMAGGFIEIDGGAGALAATISAARESPGSVNLVHFPGDGDGGGGEGEGFVMSDFGDVGGDFAASLANIDLDALLAS